MATGFAYDSAISHTTMLMTAMRGTDGRRAASPRPPHALFTFHLRRRHSHAAPPARQCPTIHEETWAPPYDMPAFIRYFRPATTFSRQRAKPVGSDRHLFLRAMTPSDDVFLMPMPMSRQIANSADSSSYRLSDAIFRARDDEASGWRRRAARPRCRARSPAATSKAILGV